MGPLNLKFLFNFRSLLLLSLSFFIAGQAEAAKIRNIENQNIPEEGFFEFQNGQFLKVQKPSRIQRRIFSESRKVVFLTLIKKQDRWFLPDLENPVGSCTSFLVQHPGMTNPSEVLLMTAAHCIPRDESFSILAFANNINRENLIQFQKQLSAVEISQTEFTYSSERDVAWVKLPASYFPTTKVLKMAERAPTISSKTHLIGYPGARGPFRIECQQVGPGVSVWDGTGHATGRDLFSIRPEAFCPIIAGSEGIQGASGGPVLNEFNEVIGVLSTQGFEVSTNTLTSGQKVKMGAVSGYVNYTGLTRRLAVREGKLDWPSFPIGFQEAERWSPADGSISTLKFALAGGVLSGPVQLLDSSGNEIYYNMAGIYVFGKQMTMTFPGDGPRFR